MRIRDRGHVNRHLLGLVFDGDAVPRHRDPIVAGDAEVGQVTTAAWSFGSLAATALQSLAARALPALPAPTVPQRVEFSTRFSQAQCPVCACPVCAVGVSERVRTLRPLR